MTTTRSVTNNWLLLALVSAVSFGGAVLYAVIRDADSPVFLLYFVVTAAAVAGIAFWWFGSNPPRLAAPGWAYLGVIALLILGGTFLGMLPGTRAIASWLTIGVCFTVYGVLERSTAITVTGAATLAAAVVGYVVDPDRLGLVLELTTGAVFAAGASWLWRSRPAPRPAGATGGSPRTSTS